MGGSRQNEIRTKDGFCLLRLTCLVSFAHSFANLSDCLPVFRFDPEAAPAHAGNTPQGFNALSNLEYIREEPGNAAEMLFNIAVMVCLPCLGVQLSATKLNKTRHRRLSEPIAHSAVACIWWWKYAAAASPSVLVSVFARPKGLKWLTANI